MGRDYPLAMVLAICSRRASDIGVVPQDGSLISIVPESLLRLWFSSSWKIFSAMALALSLA